LTSSRGGSFEPGLACAPAPTPPVGIALTNGII
jgi:hypothetical protein